MGDGGEAGRLAKRQGDRLVRVSDAAGDPANTGAWRRQPAPPDWAAPAAVVPIASAPTPMVMIVVAAPAPVVVICRERRTVGRARGNLPNRSGVREAGSQTNGGPPEGARDCSRACEFLQHATTPSCASTYMSPTPNTTLSRQYSRCRPRNEGSASRVAMSLGRPRAMSGKRFRS